MKSSLKYLQWGALGLALLLGGIWEFFPLKDASERLDGFPVWGAGFTGEEIPVTDVERSVFKENKLIKRYYQVGEQIFFFSAVDGTKHRSAVHDPTLCFQGSGWEIGERREITVPGGHAALVTLNKDSRKKEVMIWFSDGETRYSSVMKYWFATTLRRLTLGVSGEEPVRIIIQPQDEQPFDWDKLITDFSELWAL